MEGFFLKRGQGSNSFLGCSGQNDQLEEKMYYTIVKLFIIVVLPTFIPNATRNYNNENYVQNIGSDQAS